MFTVSNPFGGGGAIPQSASQPNPFAAANQSQSAALSQSPGGFHSGVPAQFSQSAPGFHTTAPSSVGGGGFTTNAQPSFIQSPSGGGSGFFGAGQQQMSTAPMTNGGAIPQSQAQQGGWGQFGGGGATNSQSQMTHPFGAAPPNMGMQQKPVQQQGFGGMQGAHQQNFASWGQQAPAQQQPAANPFMVCVFCT